MATAEAAAHLPWYLHLARIPIQQQQPLLEQHAMQEKGMGGGWKQKIVPQGLRLRLRHTTQRGQMASSGRWQCQATIAVAVVTVVVVVVVGNVAVVAHVVNKLRQLSTTSAICRAKSNAKGGPARVALMEEG